MNYLSRVAVISLPVLLIGSGWWCFHDESSGSKTLTTRSSSVSYREATRRGSDNSESKRNTKSSRRAWQRSPSSNLDHDHVSKEVLSSAYREKITTLSSKLPKAELQSRIDAILAVTGKKGLKLMLDTFGKNHDTHSYPSWLKQILIERASVAYLNGQLGTANEVIDVVGGGDYYNKTEMVFLLSQKMVTTAEPRKAFEELLAAGTKVAPFYYDTLAGETAVRAGYKESLAMISDFSKQGFGHDAALEITRIWLHNRPEDAVSYIEALPDGSPLKELSYGSLARHAMDNGAYDTANEWALLISDENDRNLYLKNIETSRNILSNVIEDAR